MLATCACLPDKQPHGSCRRHSDVGGGIGSASHTFVDLVSGGIGALLPTLKDRFSLNSMQAGAIIATLAASTRLSPSRSAAGWRTGSAPAA